MKKSEEYVFEMDCESDGYQSIYRYDDVEKAINKAQCEALDYLIGELVKFDHVSKSVGEFIVMATKLKYCDLDNKENFEEKNDSNCQHQKREYIAELNSDLCLVCGTLIKE